jgi:hypothetical protein
MGEKYLSWEIKDFPVGSETLKEELERFSWITTHPNERNPSRFFVVRCYGDPAWIRFLEYATDGNHIPEILITFLKINIKYSLSEVLVESLHLPYKEGEKEVSEIYFAFEKRRRVH